MPDASNFHTGRKKLASVDEFMGLCVGVIADGVVNKPEVQFLLNWLGARDYLLDDPMVRRVWDVLSGALAGFDDESEARVLAVLVEYTGAPDPEAVDNMASTLPLTKPVPEIEFLDKSFCFTGVFEFGSRSDCMGQTEQIGGVCSKSLTSKVNYLVIGSTVSPDWKYSSYGKKILDAVAKNDSGKAAIAIISEADWLRAVRAELQK